MVSPVTVRFRTQDGEKLVKLLKGVKEVVILNDADTIEDPRTMQLRHPGLEGAKAMAAELWRAGIVTKIGRLPKPDGVQKIDVNELGRDAIARGGGGDAGETEAVTLFERLTLTAETYPEFLVSEIGKDGQPVDNTALEEHLKSLAVVATELTEMQQEDLFDKAFAKGPKKAKTKAKKAFDQAVREEAKKQGKKEKEKEVGGGTDSNNSPKQKSSAKMRGVAISEDIGFYERVDSSGQTEEISTFSLTLLKRVSGVPKLLMCRVTGINRDVLVDEWIIPKKAWGRRHAFQDSFPDEQMQWTGDDDDVQRLQAMLTSKNEGFKDIPIVASTETLGRYGEGDKLRFVLPSGTMDRNGWMKDPDLVFYLDGDSNLQKRLPTKKLPIDTPEVRQLAKLYFEEILTLHNTIAMATILGWWVSSLFRPDLIKILNGHPILNVFGRAGSGKTTTLTRAFWVAFTGITQYDVLDCGASAFVQAKDFSSSNAIAIMMDEFKPSDMNPKLVEILLRGIRNLFNGGTSSRGISSLHVRSYTYATPLAIAGETRLDMDQALVERCIYVGLDGNWVATHPDAATRWDFFQAQPWHQIAPFLQCWSLRADVGKMLEQAQILTTSALNYLGQPTVAERIRKALMTIAFGLIGVQMLATELGATVPIVDFNKIASTLLAESLGMDEGGKLEKHVRDNFDDFVIDSSIMAGLGLIKEGRHFAEVNNNLCLWVAGIEAVRSEWRRTQGLPGVSPGVRALTRIASEKQISGLSYIVSVGKITALEASGPIEETTVSSKGETKKRSVVKGARVRCVEIDTGAIPTSFKVEPFVINSPRTWGGHEKEDTSKFQSDITIN